MTIVKNSLLRPIFLAIGILFSEVVSADITMFLETPKASETVSGVLFVRGWATAPDGIDRVELTINGKSPAGGTPFIIPMGESRPDVNKLYPNNIGSENSGFNIGFFFSSTEYDPDKKATMVVTAFDKKGASKIETRNFYIDRFETSAPNNFIRDLAIIDMTQASVSTDTYAIYLRNVLIDKKKYNVTIDFNPTLQSLAISSIYPVSP